ncbi:MAG: hypothetical protein HOQ05_10845 [Corynebacteriales bacterium]|nr:hypothetical protein [Mycobacteriales bacterium]
MAGGKRQLFDEDAARAFIIRRLSEPDALITQARENLTLKGFAAWCIAYLSWAPKGFVAGDAIPHYDALATVLGYGHSLTAWEGIRTLVDSGLVSQEFVQGRTTPLTHLVRRAKRADVAAIENGSQARSVRTEKQPLVGSVPRAVTHQRAVRAQKRNSRAITGEQAYELIADQLRAPVLPDAAPAVQVGASGFMLLHLVELMRSKTLPPGSQIPSVRALEDLYPNSTQKGRRDVLEQLASLGLVDKQRGRAGTVVAAVPSRAHIVALVEVAANLPAEQKYAPRQAPNNVQFDSNRFSQMQSYLTAEPRRWRAARISASASAAFLAEAIDAVSRPEAQFPTQPWLAGTLEKNNSFVSEMTQILKRAGWVRAHEGHTVVNPRDSRRGSIQEIREGAFLPSIPGRDKESAHTHTKALASQPMASRRTR